MGIVGTLGGGRWFDHAVRSDPDPRVLGPPAVLFLAASITTTAALFAPAGWMSIALFVPSMLSFSFMLPWGFGAAHLVARPWSSGAGIQPRHDWQRPYRAGPRPLVRRRGERCCKRSRYSKRSRAWPIDRALGEHPVRPGASRRQQKGRRFPSAALNTSPSTQHQRRPGLLKRRNLNA